MRVDGASLIYVNDASGNEWQTDMRLIIRPRMIAHNSVVFEMTNESTKDMDIKNENLFSFECSSAEAREIAAALILAAETAEKKQGENHAEAE